MAKARFKMGANSKQRSIKDIMSVAQLRSKENTKSKTEGGRCVSVAQLTTVSGASQVPEQESPPSVMPSRDEMPSLEPEQGCGPSLVREKESPTSLEQEQMGVAQLSSRDVTSPGPEKMSVAQLTTGCDLPVHRVSVAQLKQGVKGEEKSKPLLFKTAKEGGGCVNAQTGSKSNIVKTKEMKMSVAELREKFNEMRKEDCEKCAKLIRVKCAECMKIVKCGSFVKTQRERWTKPSAFSTQTEGGSRGRMVKAKVKGSTEETKNKSNPNLKSELISERKNFAEQPLKKSNVISNITSRNTSSSYNLVGEEGSGKNNISKTESNLNVTPIKRKLLSTKQVSKLVPVFNCTHVLSGTLPSESFQESPAKRRKVQLGSEGGGMSTLSKPIV